MEGRCHLQRHDLHFLRLEQRNGRVHGRIGTGDHRVLRCIVGCDHGAGPCDQPLDRFGWGQNGGHGSDACPAFHQAASLAHEAQGVLEFDRAGKGGGGNFSHAVTDYQGGLHAPGSPQVGDGIFDAHQQWLDEVGAAIGKRTAGHDPADHAIENRVATRQGLAEPGLAQQALRHPAILAALTGKQKCDAGWIACLPRGGLLQGLAGGAGVVGGDGEAPGHGRAARCKARGEGRKVGCRVSEPRERLGLDGFGRRRVACGDRDDRPG